MNSFFEKQNVDEVGRTAVRLEKLLIALGLLYILPALVLPHPLFLLGIAFQMVFIIAAWKGAVHRRESLLRLYYVFNLIFILLSVIAITVSFVAVAKYSHEHKQFNKGNEMKHFSPSSSPLLNTVASYLPAVSRNTEFNHDTGVIGAPKPSHPLQQRPQHPHIAVAPRHKVSSVSIVAAFLLLAYFLAMFALKVSTILLAIRLSKQIRTSQAVHLAHPVLRKTNSNGNNQLFTASRPLYIPLDSVDHNNVTFQVYSPQMSQNTFYYPSQHAQV